MSSTLSRNRRPAATRGGATLNNAFGAPPAHAASFRSDDLDEIHAFIARYDGLHRRTAMEAGSLGYAVHATKCGEVDLGWSVTRRRQKVEGTPRAALLHVPLGRRHLYVSGSRAFEASPDAAVLLPPEHEYALFFEPDDLVAVLRMPAAAIEAEVAAREPSGGGVTARPFEIAGSRLHELAALHRDLVGASPPRGRAPDAVASQLSARLAAWIAQAWLGERSARAASGLALARVRNVEAWIDAHYGSPITLGRLCEVAGVGDRQLEAAFRHYRGQPPMQFVAARRLANARRRLLDARPGDAVTKIAHDCGFVHLGRFAIRYRTAYREPPSATLRRALRQG